jgi:DNA-directed RNA polymerase subunit RPC12/RpoP
MRAKKQHAEATRSIPQCPDCGALLRAISYTTWGTMRFDANRKLYIEDDSPGNADIEYSCTKCSSKLDPEGILF